jgi:gluconate kinase
MCEISESQWSALLQIIHKFFQTNKDANKRNVPVALCDDIFVVWFLDDHYFHFLASILNTEFIFLHSSSATLFNLKTFERDFFNKESALESQIDDVAQTDMEECDKHTFMNENLVGSSEISQIISSCLIPLMFSRFSRETSVSTLYDKKTFLSQAPVEYPGEFIDIHDDSVSQKHTVGNVLGEPLSFLNDVSISKLRKTLTSCVE